MFSQVRSPAEFVIQFTTLNQLMTVLILMPAPAILFLEVVTMFLNGNVHVPDTALYFISHALLTKLVFTAKGDNVPDMSQRVALPIIVLGHGVTMSHVTEEVKTVWPDIEEITEIDFELEQYPEMVNTLAYVTGEHGEDVEQALKSVLDAELNESYGFTSNSVDYELENAKTVYRYRHNLKEDARVSRYDIFIDNLKTVTERIIKQAETLRDHSCEYPAWEDLGNRASICRICGKNGDI